MELSAIAQIIAFAIFAFISVAGAIGMTTTMSMFRSGIFLMASFIGVGGLFILLTADLLGLLQVMMYIGGMLIMILFMVLFSGDPGGAMMAKMDLPLLERIFSSGLMKNVKEEDGGMDMDMSGMSMMTPIKKPAAIIAVIVGGILISMLLIFPIPHPTPDLPDPDSAHRIGYLLMGKYMMAFEGAGLLILLGIFGAVYIARTHQHPDDSDRAADSAIDKVPPPIASDTLEPYYQIDPEVLSDEESTHE